MRNRSDSSAAPDETGGRDAATALSPFGYAHWLELRFVADYVFSGTRPRRDQSLSDLQKKTGAPMSDLARKPDRSPSR
jgi:hypothetical protein